jgi:hypothetical protein
VKHFVRVALVAFGALMGVFGLGLLAINLYVQSPGTQLMVREAVSDSIGLPISVFRISFTPWGGFLFQDVTIGNPSAQFPLARAERLTVTCDFLPFFHRRIAIKQIALQRVDLNIPVSSPDALADSDEDGAANPKPPIVPASPERPKLSESPPRIHRKHDSWLPLPHHFWLEIRKIKMRDGAVHLIGPDGSNILSMRGVDCSVGFQNGDYMGKLRTDAAILKNSLALEDIASPISCRGGKLKLEQITGTISGGQLAGNFEIDLNDPDFPYRLAVQVNGVNLNAMASRAGGVLDRAHGVLQGSFELTGSGADTGQTSGNGYLELKTGYLDQYPLLQEIGKWTQIDEFRRLELEQADSHFHVIGSTVQIDSLRLVSKNCQIDLWGKIQDARNLALSGRLTVSPFLSQKIPNELEDNFVTGPDGHTRYLDFQVSGPVLRPQTNLFDRLIGDRRRLLKRIIRGERHEHNHDQDSSNLSATAHPTQS